MAQAIIPACKRDRKGAERHGEKDWELGDGWSRSVRHRYVRLDVVDSHLGRCGVELTKLGEL